MKVFFRWFGKNDDHISLKHICQIPNLQGICWTISDIPVGHVWSEKDIKKVVDYISKYNLKVDVVESVNIHEDIKLGKKTRDNYIDNYIKTIINLSKYGVKVICYNFMPVFDWVKSDLSKVLNDLSMTFNYDNNSIKNITPENIISKMKKSSKNFTLPGWEEYRINDLKHVFKEYESVGEEELFNNLKYFLKKVIPYCEEFDVKLAIHPDDPPWSVFNLPRIVTSKEKLDRIMSMVNSNYNGITLCTGSLGANKENNLVELIKYFGQMDRIHYAHIRNIKFSGFKSFYETSHFTDDGSFDMYEIMKAFKDINFKGYIRPDHGRMIWEEEGRPGYGLYDRALGIAYINGLWEALLKNVPQ